MIACFFKSEKVANSYDICSTSKFKIVGTKLSRIITVRIAFQSSTASLSIKHIDSRAIFTGNGGLLIDLTSTKCCLFMALTAIEHLFFEDCKDPTIAWNEWLCKKEGAKNENKLVSLRYVISLEIDNSGNKIVSL